MSSLLNLVYRNFKLFFKDKGMFFTALMTPIILLVLYATFLSQVYKDAFSTAIENFNVSESLVNGVVGGQLISSLLSVSCITVAFSANLLTINDKVTGTRKDLLMSPIKPKTLALGYFISTAITTLIICFLALFVGFIYLSIIGFYLTFTDVLLLILDVVILSLFGTALSSMVNCLLSTAGQASAVGAIVSAGYGFICGAYMPISSFSIGLQKVVSLLPGTYGTAIFRNHSLSGVFNALIDSGVPSSAIDTFKGLVDCKISFFGHNVAIWVMYLVLILSTIIFIGVYILMCTYLTKRKK